MVWYSKTKLRRRFLALIEEKKPLVQVCRAGESTTLGEPHHPKAFFLKISFLCHIKQVACTGTRAEQKIMVFLRKHADKLKIVVKTYNEHVQAFSLKCPNLPSPPRIEYTKLLRLQSEDPFWNNGLFTNAHDPQAVYETTQRGIQSFSYLNRAKEELQRLGWETRRAIQWATNRHNHLKLLLKQLVHICNKPQLIDNLPLHIQLF